MLDFDGGEGCVGGFVVGQSAGVIGLMATRDGELVGIADWNLAFVFHID